MMSNYILYIDINIGEISLKEDTYIKLDIIFLIFVSMVVQRYLDWGDQLNLLEQLLLGQILHEVVIDSALSIGQAISGNVQGSLHGLKKDENFW